MKTTPITAALTALLLAGSAALAADDAAKAPAKKSGTQQNKMAACSKEAGGKGLKGDERKAFMKQCLSAKPAGAQNS
jgi:hypothetical protein